MRDIESISEIKFILNFIANLFTSGNSIVQIKNILSELEENGKISHEAVQIAHRVYGIEKANYFKLGTLINKIPSVQKVISYIDAQCKDLGIDEYEQCIIKSLKSLLASGYINETIYKSMLDFYGCNGNSQGNDFNKEFMEWLGKGRLILVGENILSKREIVSGILKFDSPILREVNKYELERIMSTKHDTAIGIINSIIDNYSKSFDYIYTHGSRASKGIYEDFRQIEALYIIHALLEEVEIEIKVRSSSDKVTTYKSKLIQPNDKHRIYTNFPNGISIKNVVSLRVTYTSNKNSSENKPVHTKVREAISRLEPYRDGPVKIPGHEQNSIKQIIRIEDNLLSSILSGKHRQLSMDELKGIHNTSELEEMLFKLNAQHDLYVKLLIDNPSKLFIADSFIDDAYIVFGLNYKTVIKVTNDYGCISIEAKTCLRQYDMPNMQILYSIPKGLERYRNIGQRAGTEIKTFDGNQIKLYSMDQKYESAIGSIAAEIIKRQ